MQNKIYLIALSIILIILFTSTTCNKKNNYWEIGDVEALFSGISGLYFYSDSLTPIKDDTILMRLYISPKHLNVNNINLSFVTEAHAFSAANYYLNHSISELIISSDHDFHGKAAGENINEDIVFLSGANYNYTDSVWTYNDTLSVQEYVFRNLVQGTPDYDIYNHIFMFKKRPEASKQVFYFDFINSKGTHYFGKSDTLWVE